MLAAGAALTEDYSGSQRISFFFLLNIHRNKDIILNS